MPEADQVVSNTSPLLNLALISRLDLLAEQFETVHVPRQVWEELADGTDGMEDLRTLRSRDFLSVVPVEETDLYVEIARQLDEGETAAITYAIKSDADLVLIDERDGRRVARRHDLRVTGVIGMLLRAAGVGTVELQDELDALRESGFWISDGLYEEALQRGTESES